MSLLINIMEPVPLKQRLFRTGVSDLPPAFSSNGCPFKYPEYIGCAEFPKTAKIGLLGTAVIMHAAANSLRMLC